MAQPAGHAHPAGRARPPRAARSTRPPASAGCCSAPSSPPTSATSTRTSCPTCTGSSARSTGARGSCSPASATATRSIGTGWPAAPTSWSGRRDHPLRVRQRRAPPLQQAPRCGLRRRAAGADDPPLGEPGAAPGHAVARADRPVARQPTSPASTGVAAVVARRLRRPGGLGPRRARLRARHRPSRPAREVLAMFRSACARSTPTSAATRRHRGQAASTTSARPAAS